MFFSRQKDVVVRTREQHNISRQNIDPDALRVLYRLSTAGFTAYLVGGSVRDLLLGRQPKDFDIGTDAHPGQIRKLFRNCYLVGRRFRLAHIIFGRKVIETSTFRRQPQSDEADENVPGGLYQSEDNTFGTPEEDARRRDFTVNGLFYDIRTFSVIDYVGGLGDLDSRTMRSIGDPNVRFREDPVRMMRAVRFAARLGFRMDWSCRRAVRRHYAEIVHASTPRLFEEIMRLFTHRSAAPAFKLLWEYRLFSVLLPEVNEFIEGHGGARAPVWGQLEALDKDELGDDASNGLRLATLHYAPFAKLLETATRQGGYVNGFAVAQDALGPFVERLQVPRQTAYLAAMLLDAQRHFDDGARRGRRMRLARHDVFPEALALRRIVLTAAGEDVSTLRECEAESAHAHRPHHAPAGGRQAEASREDTGREAPEEAGDMPPPDAMGGEPGDAPPRRRHRRGGRGRGRRETGVQNAERGTRNAESGPRNPEPGDRTPHSELRTPHSGLRTPHSTLRTSASDPHGNASVPPAASRPPDKGGDSDLSSDAG